MKETKVKYAETAGMALNIPLQPASIIDSGTFLLDLMPVGIVARDRDEIFPLLPSELPLVEDLENELPIPLIWIPELDWDHIDDIFPRAMADLLSDHNLANHPLAILPRMDLAHMPRGTLDYFLKGTGVGTDPVYSLLVATDIPELNWGHIEGIFPLAIAAILSDHDLDRHPLAIIPVMDDDHIPDIETLSYGAAFAEAQIPHTFSDIFTVNNILNANQVRTSLLTTIEEDADLSISTLTAGYAINLLRKLEMGGTEIITTARALQNVTADTGILTSGILATARGGLGKALTPTWTDDFVLVYKSGTDDWRMELKGAMPADITVDSITLSIANPDVNLYRSAANILKTDDSLFIGSNNEFQFDIPNLGFYFHNPNNNWDRDFRGYDDRLALIMSNTGDKFAIESNVGVQVFALKRDGKLEFGTDVNLYRSAANLLKTDDTLDALALKIGGTDVITSTCLP